MFWVHPECCGDTKDDLKYFGVYSCSECRLIGKRVRNVEKQLSDMHILNMDLIKKLQNSQEECSNRRKQLSVLFDEKSQTVRIKKNYCDIPGYNVTAALKAKPITDKSHCHASTQNNGNSIPNPNTGSTPISPLPRPRPRSSQVNHSSPSDDKPKIILVGDSMVHGSGPLLASELTEHNTCVLSHSGQTVLDASSSISDLLQNHRNGDLIMLHLGTNDLDQLTRVNICDNYGRLLDKIKQAAQTVQ